MLLKGSADSHTGPYFHVFGGRHHTSYCVVINVSFRVGRDVFLYTLV